MKTPTTRRNTRKAKGGARSHRSAKHDERIAQLHNELTRKVSDLADSDQWRAFLDFCAAFHTYSANNVLLILAQRPTATRVAGYERWKELGRQVIKDEKGIRIRGYNRRTVTETDPVTGEETTRTTVSYPIVTVFDIAQTKPIPGAPQPDPIARHLTGGDPTGIYDRAASALSARGWTVERELIEGETNGYTTLSGERRVAVDARLSPAHAAKTILHEFAHVILHAEPLRTKGGADSAQVRHRGLEETEAESVAYIVAALAGLDTTAYSTGYITTWTDGDIELLHATAENVHTAALQIAEVLEITA